LYTNQSIFNLIKSTNKSIQIENRICLGFNPISEFGNATGRFEQSGCEQIFQEKASGVRSERPKLLAMQQILRKGDVIYIYKLDRLGRSLKHLLEMTSAFEKQGVALIYLNDHIDTTTARGRLIFNIFASLSEFERDLIRVVITMCVGVFNVLCFVIATKLASPERRGRAIAMVTLGFNLALIIGLPIGRIITGLLRWKAIFIFTAVLSLLSIFMVFRLIPSLGGEPPYISCFIFKNIIQDEPIQIISCKGIFIYVKFI